LILASSARWFLKVRLPALLAVQLRGQCLHLVGKLRHSQPLGFLPGRFQ
jgi:hypothetical protein